VVRPEDAGRGATPQSWANAAELLSLSGLSPVVSKSCLGPGGVVRADHYEGLSSVGSVTPMTSMAFQVELLDGGAGHLWATNSSV
jgi:hypothetical protein